MSYIVVIGFFVTVLFLATKAFAAFTINSVSPNSINFPDDVVTISASASGLQNTTQYLEAAFTKEGESSNYFGFTKNLSDEWYVYKSSPTTSDLSSYFYSFLPVNGAWAGQISAKLDVSDSGFKGAGNYVIRLSKYITSSASYSNTVVIAVNITPTPTVVPTITTVPTPTKIPPTPSPTPSQSPTATPALTVLASTHVATSSSERNEYEDKSEPATESLGDLISTQSASPKKTTSKKGKVLKASSFNSSFLFISLGVLFLSACGILSAREYLKYRKIKNMLDG